MKALKADGGGRGVATSGGPCVVPGRWWRREWHAKVGSGGAQFSRDSARIDRMGEIDGLIDARRSSTCAVQHSPASEAANTCCRCLH